MKILLFLLFFFPVIYGMADYPTLHPKILHYIMNEDIPLPFLQALPMDQACEIQRLRNELLHEKALYYITTNKEIRLQDDRVSRAKDLLNSWGYCINGQDLYEYLLNLGEDTPQFNFCLLSNDAVLSAFCLASRIVPINELPLLKEKFNSFIGDDIKLIDLKKHPPLVILTPARLLPSFYK